MSGHDRTRRCKTTGGAVLLLALALPVPLSAAEELTETEKFVFVNCGRCHVVMPDRRMGGIGSTPSFMALRAQEGWEDKAKAFWTQNPHPAFTQIEGVTEPFPENRPSPIHPITLTLDEVERILAYMRSLAPADLGETVQMR